jgi:glycosyltransferase involved in cell wall biosynthesis
MNLDARNTYYLICPEYFKILDKYQRAKSIKIVNLNVKNDLIYKFFSINRFLKKEKIDIYWTPTQDSLFFKIKGVKIVITVHDISFEHHRNWFNYKIRLMSWLGIYKLFLKKSDYLFYDSNFTKNDVEQTYNIHKPGLVTYMGTSEQFKKIDKQTAVRYVADHFNIKSRYLFYLDTVRFENLFKAFALFLSDRKNVDIQMVCLGQFCYQNILNYAKKLNIENNIIWIKDRVSDHDLNNLYSAAEFFVSPSEYEGFGLTPLESLECGTPILVSNVTSLPEVFMDAALYCDPYDVHDIHEKIKLLHNNEKLQSQILSKANKLFQIFDWDNIARQILNIINSLQNE